METSPMCPGSLEHTCKDGDMENSKGSGRDHGYYQALKNRPHLRQTRSMAEKNLAPLPSLPQLLFCCLCYSASIPEDTMLPLKSPAWQFLSYDPHSVLTDLKLSFIILLFLPRLIWKALCPSLFCNIFHTSNKQLMAQSTNSDEQLLYEILCIRPGEMASSVKCLRANMRTRVWSLEPMEVGRVVVLLI